MVNRSRGEHRAAAGGSTRPSSAHRAVTVVPLALLAGAWAVDFSGGGLASAASDETVATSPDVPVVPTSPFEVPASVAMPAVDRLPNGVDPQAGPEGTVSTLSSNGIPSAALFAYQRGEQVLAEADPVCKVDWALIAAIGRVESDHGRYGGNVLGADGVSRPGIIGIALDGTNDTAAIRDTDNGRLDDDTVWDRAVGPMQFIPSTWAVVGLDGDGDGEKDPQDVDDAALASAVYLCAGDDDLSLVSGARGAVLRYNQSSEYADLVLSIAEAYRDGDYTMVPSDTPASPTLTDLDNDQLADEPAGPKPTPEPHEADSDGGGNGADTDSADDDAGVEPDDSGSGGGPDDGGTDGDGDGGGDGGTGGGNGGDGGDGSGDGGGGGGPLPPQVQEPVEEAEEVVEDTLATLAEATAFCRRQMGQQPGGVISRCADAVLGQTVERATGTVSGLLEDLLGDAGGVLG